MIIRSKIRIKDLQKGDTIEDFGRIFKVITVSATHIRCYGEEYPFDPHLKRLYGKNSMQLVWLLKEEKIKHHEYQFDNHARSGNQGFVAKIAKQPASSPKSWY